MLQVDYVTIRDVQRNYKKISDEVNKKDIAFIVMSSNRPQFVVVSLKTLSKLQAFPLPYKPAEQKKKS